MICRKGRASEPLIHPFSEKGTVRIWHRLFSPCHYLFLESGSWYNNNCSVLKKKKSTKSVDVRNPHFLYFLWARLLCLAFNQCPPTHTCTPTPICVDVCVCKYILVLRSSPTIKNFSPTYCRWIRLQ